MINLQESKKKKPKFFRKIESNLKKRKITCIIQETKEHTRYE
jgi:hypothetical protein